MQTAGGGLQVIRSVEFQERGGAGKHLHIAHLVTPSMLLFVLFVLLFDCVWEGMKSRAPLVGREDEFIF